MLARPTRTPSSLGVGVRPARVVSPTRHASPSRCSSPVRRARGARFSRRGCASAAQLALAALAVLFGLRVLLLRWLPGGGSHARGTAAVHTSRHDPAALLQTTGGAAAAPLLPISCYSGTTDGGGALGSVPLSPGAVCARYRLRCAGADVAAGVCTDEEAEGGTEKHVHTAMAAAACAQLADAVAYHGRYADVQCCDDTELCNAPRADTGGPSGQQAGRGGRGGHGERGDDDYAPLLPVVRCAAGGHGAAAAVVPAHGGRCVRYGARCDDGPDGDAGCTHEAAATGPLLAVLRSASAEECEDMAAQPQLYRQLLCCAEELCNDGRGGGFGAALAGEPPKLRAKKGAAAARAGVRRAGGGS
jgi:hypothetical protein